MAYDPKQPFHLRYVQIHRWSRHRARSPGRHRAVTPRLRLEHRRVARWAASYAIDFMNCAPDADLNSVGKSNFEWVVNNMAEVLIEIATGQKPLELTGSWPKKMPVDKAVEAPI
jgi:hypothetical protein